MRSTVKLSLLSLLIAATLSSFAGDVDAKRLGGGRTMGSRATDAGGAGPTIQRMESPASPGLSAAISGSETKRAVLTGVAAGTAAGLARNAAADAREASNAALSPAAASASAATSASIAETEARLRRLDAYAEREKSREAAKTDKPADAAAEKPVVKTAAERRREQKDAEEKAALEKKDEARKTQLAKEVSCRIEPVMTDAAIQHCRQVFRSL